METHIMTTSEVEQASPAQLMQALETSDKGLTTSEAKARLQHYGPNALEEHHVSAVRQFLGYFWGPIPGMIEIAAILSLAVQHWTDFVVILTLLIFNAGVGFWQEHKATNALDALKQQMALQARVRRDAKWQSIVARELVPGDIVRIRLGDIVPADIKLTSGDVLGVDQSALTGESLPVDKHTGDIIYSGSLVKQGEMVGLVANTGSHTFFGRTAKLVESAGAVSHFQKAVLQIGDYLIYLSLGLVAVLFLVEIVRGTPVLDLVQFALILTVAAIPVAMPAVLSVTMAVGALALSKQHAIVSRLEAVEEMAGIDVLCSDKTGTLTQNRLTLGDPVVVDAADVSQVVMAAALASKAEDQDPIDLAVIAGVKDSAQITRYQQVSFTPFDPVHKRTEANIRDAEGKTFSVTKGAPQVILALCHLEAAREAKAKQQIAELASHGYRTLGVARTDDATTWRFLGILPLLDPPREDSATTIAQAKEHGIEVKMVTGDNVAIAREIAGKLGLGTHILPADEVFARGEDSGSTQAISSKEAEQIEQMDGFAQVFPEHKYRIVKALQAGGHFVGMTGDGVNDAPALKQANVGVAVSGATDAARSAAALVLTAPGLSVIVSAVDEARRIFERMNSYAIYRITETIRIMFFVVLSIIVFNFYPITALLIILLAFFNDLPILTIAYDHTWLDPTPVHWEMPRILRVSSVLGLLGVIETFGILVLARTWLHLDVAHIQTLIFLKLALAGHLTLFIARTRKPFWSKPYPAPILLWSAIGTKLLATVFVLFPLGLIAAITWPQAAFVWGYCLVWMFIEDWAKLQVYAHLHLDAPRHRHFLSLLKRPLGPQTQ